MKFAVIGCVKAEFDWSEVNNPARVVHLLESDGLADKRFAHEEPLSLPHYVAAAANSARDEPGGIFDRRQPGRIRPRGRRVEIGRDSTVTAGVRSYVVVMVPEPIELSLLLATVLRRPAADQRLHVAVNAFEQTILLRVTWLRQARPDTESDPANRQL